jgi:hypothetical protein
VVRVASTMAMDARQSQRAYLQAQAAVQRCDAASRRWGSAAVRSHTYRGKIRFEFPPHCAACVPPLLGRPLYRNSTVGQMDQDRFIIFVSSHYPVFKLNRRLGSTAPDLALCVSTSRRCGPLVAGEVKRPLSSCLPTSQVLL